MKTIGQFFGIKDVTVFTSRHAIDDSVVQGTRPIGVEIELENLSPNISLQFPGFNFTPDGSLRSIDGKLAIEAVTLPVQINAVKALLEIFYKKFGITQDNFSERCSIHVHFNVLDITPEQLASICLVYQTVERLLFTLVDADRKASIFCVPWYQSGLTYNYVNSILKDPSKVRRWQKYTALNLIPAGVQGTIEFRHMQGCADVGRIYQWIRTIARIFDYCVSKTFEEIKLEILDMNTVSNYQQWLSSVFKEEADNFYRVPNFEKELFRGVVDTKYMLSTEAEPVQKKTEPLRYIDDEGPRETNNQMVREWANAFNPAIVNTVVTDDGEALRPWQVNVRDTLQAIRERDQRTRAERDRLLRDAPQPAPSTLNPTRTRGNR